MIVLLPFLVCIVGLVIYGLSNNGKVAEVGRIAYAFGLLVFLLEAGPRALSLLR